MKPDVLAEDEDGITATRSVVTCCVGPENVAIAGNLFMEAAPCPRGGELADLGTLLADTTVFRGPWMHDGCAETLADRFLDPWCGATRQDVARFFRGGADLATVRWLRSVRS